MLPIITAKIEYKKIVKNIVISGTLLLIIINLINSIKQNNGLNRK